MTGGAWKRARIIGREASGVGNWNRVLSEIAEHGAESGTCGSRLAGDEAGRSDGVLGRLQSLHG